MCDCTCSQLITVSAKCSDLCFVDIDNKKELNGYVPHDLNIGCGDYISFRYCCNCGKIQDTWPLDISHYVDNDED